MHKHAVTRIGMPSQQRDRHDANSNVTRCTAPWGARIALTYDAENRLTGVSGGATASFVYDGDGKRVRATVNGVTTAYIGNYYERNLNTGVVTKYYIIPEGGYANGQRACPERSRRVALRRNGVLYYLLTDHLGSTSAVIDQNGAVTARQLYTPYGEARGASGTLPTDYRFTGQRAETGLGSLYDYNARH